MRRLDILWGLAAVVATMVACSKEESARRTTDDLGCTEPSCGGVDGGVVVREAGADAAAPRDATTPPAFDPDGATPPTTGDVFVPPFDRDSGIDNGDASLSLFDVAPPFDALPPTPDSAVVVPPLPNTTVCENSGTVAFRTDLLEAVGADAGAGIPAAPLAFRTAWHNAQVMSGRPGPALIVLSNLGNLADGGARRFRFGTPEGRLVGDSALDALFSFERPSANPQNPSNPFDGPFTVQNTTRAQGSLLGANGTATVLLRFARADRTRYDIPVVGVSFDASLRAGLDGKCTALDIVDLALGIPSSALSRTLDGQPLSTLLGAAVTPPDGGPSLAIVHLSGVAPVAPFEEVP
jgi:hypothetical protein